MNRLFSCSLLLAVGLLAGCATQNVNSVSRAEPQAMPTLVNDRRVITDRSLGNTIRIVSVNESVVSGNLKKVQVTLENIRSNARVISYKFEWIQQDGMAAAGVTEAWKPLALAGRETVTVAAVAGSPRAVDFTLKLIEGK